MLNNINVSNLQVFNKEGASLLPCSSDSQEAMQAAIAKKVGKLLNAEGFLTLIPDFDPLKDTKLRIHLTKDGITIQLLERDSGESKVDSSYTKKDPELSKEIKTRKEKIIKKIDLLFKEPSFPDLSTRLESEKIHPLFIPSQPDKNEQSPFRIGFDATVSNPQIQQLHTKIEGLQDQLNKKTPHAEDLQIIKEQLQFLTQAIHDLSRKQENITYPHSEEYVLIHKLVDNQQNIYRALLDLLSRNLTQLTPSPPQKIENSALKEMLFKLQQEKTALEETRDTLNKSNVTLQENLLSKEQEIQGLPTNETLQELQSQLDKLQSEKAHLQLQQAALSSQLDKALQTRDALNKSNVTLQENLLSKEQEIQGLPTNETLQELQSQLDKLQSEKAHLQLQQDVKDKQILELNEETQRLSQAYQVLQNQLENEKEMLSILETATIPEVSKEIASIDTIIEEAEKATEEALSSLENSTTSASLLSPASGYYTLTTMPSLEESSLETSSETTLLQAQINALQEELKDIRPVAYNTTNIIEKMKKSNEDLTLELSEKTKTIENLEEEKKFLESQLDRSESQVKKLKTAQYQLKKQQKEISVSSDENNDLLEELEKIQRQLSSEKRERAQLEQIHQEQLEKLGVLYDKNVLEERERINAKILNLQQKQKKICFTLTRDLADYVTSGSVTEEIGQNILDLVEEAFYTTGYKTLLDLIGSEEDFVPSERNVSSDEYNEDSYMM